MFVEKTIMLSGLGPERRTVVARLDDSASTTLFGPTDTILGHAIRLGDPRGGRGESPLQCTSG